MRRVPVPGKKSAEAIAKGTKGKGRNWFPESDGK